MTRELVSHVWILDPLLERPAARQITSIRGRSRAEPDLSIVIVAVREMAVHAAIDWRPDDVSLLTCRHLNTMTSVRSIAILFWSIYETYTWCSMLIEQLGESAVYTRLETESATTP